MAGLLEVTYQELNQKIKKSTVIYNYIFELRVNT